MHDPFERVLSDYTYTCMRKGKCTSTEKFLEFAGLEENRNIMVRHSCGGDPDSPLDVASVMRILERDFIAYDTTEHIPDLIEGLLNQPPECHGAGQDQLHAGRIQIGCRRVAAAGRGGKSCRS